MKDAILLQQAWPNTPYQEMVELTRERNKQYCDKHGWEFDCLIGTLDPKYADDTKGAWVKIEMIRDALAKSYRYVVWMDADTMIADMDTDLREGCPGGIGACWMRVPQPEGMFNHWNVGLLMMQNSHKVRQFVHEWLNTFPGQSRWMEQGEFNRLGMTNRVVQTISDRWNATVNYSEVPDAVIIGFHGHKSPPERLAAMRQTYELLSAKKAVEEPG